MPVNMQLRRATVLLAGAALAAGAAGCGGGDAASGSSAGSKKSSGGSRAPAAAHTAIHLSGGETTLRLDPITRRALDLAGIRVEPTGQAVRRNGALAFPISGGTLRTAPLGGRVEHAGGLRFTAAGHSIEATKLRVDPAADVVTAEVAGRRVPLLALNVGNVILPGPVPPKGSARVVIPAKASLLGGAALKQITDRLGVDVLRNGLRLGHVVVNAKA